MVVMTCGDRSPAGTRRGGTYTRGNVCVKYTIAWGLLTGVVLYITFTTTLV